MTKAEALRKIRALCKKLDGVTERPSHGSPSWFIGEKKSFLSVADNHHGDGRLAAWCCAAPGAQAMLVEANPDVYFVPAYVGHLGWVGVRLDREAPWEEIAAVIEAAYQARKAKR